LVKGAELIGGRWKTRGIPIFYTSGTRVLCLAEVAVLLPWGILPQDFILIRYEIRDKIVIQDLKEDELPTDWKVLPYGNSSQKLGSVFVLSNQHLILMVPSTVV
jgi:RES domain-containing protein